MHEPIIAHTISRKRKSGGRGGGGEKREREREGGKEGAREQVFFIYAPSDKCLEYSAQPLTS